MINRYPAIFLLFFTVLAINTLAQQPRLMLPVGHTSYISSVAFSSSGKKVITASDDKTVKIWDAASGKLLRSIDKHSSPVICAGFSIDEKKIITASFDTVKIWDAASGDLLCSFNEYTPRQSGISAIHFSSDNKYFAILPAYDTTIRVRDIRNGKLFQTLRGHTTQIQSADFSPDGKMMASTSWGNSVKVWNIETAQLIADLDVHAERVMSAYFSPDGKSVVTAADSSAIIWDIASGNILRRLNEHTRVYSARFSADGSYIVTQLLGKAYKWNVNSGKLVDTLDEYTAWLYRLPGSQYSADKKLIVANSLKDTMAVILDVATGKKLRWLGKGHTDAVSRATFSINKKYIVTTSENNPVRIWDAASGILLHSLNHYYKYPQTGSIDDLTQIQFSPDEKHLLIKRPGEKTASEWDMSSGKLSFALKEYTHPITSTQYSPDGQYLLVNYSDSTIHVWKTQSAELLYKMNGDYSDFSPDGKYFITTSWYGSTSIWDVASGKEHQRLEGSHSGFSPEGKYIITTIRGNRSITDKVWEVVTGKSLDGLNGIYTRFSPDGKYISTVYDNHTKIWDVASSKLVYTLGGISSDFSPDGKHILTQIDSAVKVWKLSSGHLQNNLEKYVKPHRRSQETYYFSQDGKYIYLTSPYYQYSNSLKVWDPSTGKMVKNLTLGLNDRIVHIDFTANKLLAINNSETKIFGLEDGQLLYSFIAIDSTDYLVTDKHNRYNGSERARKLLYFTCNEEIIELDQVKDQLWVPNLAERIMKGDSINAKTIDQLDICGLTPRVEEMNDSKDAYHFKILPRRGGLGETVLYINGIEVTRYKKTQLQNKNGTYELIIKKQELTNYFIPGQENPVTVKAWTADNTISSRGLIIKEDKSDINSTPPNLYAVLVGVSDYKGDELDLKYAAKDATYMSAAISNASRKLLNTDGNEHVFTYNLTTSNDRYLLPEKNSIKKTLEEIGKKASANDILLIFFAGHGVMEGKDKKQFYFLTADASRSSAVDAIADVGISTNELTEWIKPANIKAQKRILIFDACNSGQAIRDFVQLGKPEQGYIAARNDEKGQQIKAIEKLNNQSGLIILAASASDQNAYEMGRYSQGLLTYSLLKVMKQQPEILENGKYLDVSNWLNAAKKMVSTLAEGTGARQEPQLNSNNNFNIGLIDEEVRDKIILAAEKPLFARSNFQNTDTKIDNLKFRSAIDKELMSISSRGINADITYSADYEGADAFALTGDYKINGDTVTVNVLLVKGGTEVRHSYEAKGKITELNSLISNITSRALDWLKNNK